ncbi:MAG TPA: amidohydrolase family protein [Candidatus Angelobacter sp.]|nr:amidohydrolase family protein [Candidatus Angelobacter sp.]
MRPYDIVSTDSHLEVPPDQWGPYVDAEFRQFVPKVVRLPDGSGDAWEMPGAGLVPLGLQFAITRPGVENRYKYSRPTGISYGPGLAGTGDGHSRLREMDEDGVDADVLFPAVFGTRGVNLPVEADAAICRGYNDWLSQEYTAADPERLLGLALLPKGGIEEAIAEMRRVAGRPGIYGVVNFPECEPGDDRFFEAALELGIPLCSHGSFPAPRVEWPPKGVELDLSKSMNATAALKYILSGVFDRLPDLKIFCAETFCGWLPYAYEQVDAWYQDHGLWVNADLPRLPSDYMKRHFRWSFIVDPMAVRLRHTIGIDTIMWSTDFPHMNTDWPMSLQSIEEQMGGIPADERRRIVRDNAVELFNLPAAN